MSNWIAEVVDTFINGRPAAKPAVTIAELVRRGSSVVLFEGKLYQVTVKQIDMPGKERTR